MSELAPLQDVETWLKLSPGNADEPELTALIAAASDLVSQYCQVAFATTDVDEIRDGHGGKVLYLNQQPVTGVTSVTVEGTAIPARSGATMSGYSWNGTRIALHGYCFSCGRDNVEIVYTAGYTTVPASIAQATIELVGYLYRERDRIGLRSENVAQQTTSYVITDIPPQIRQKLDPYRRVAPVMP